MRAYVIAEIGQNHNGSTDLAKRLIDIASMPVIDAKGYEYKPADAIKLQKRDLKQELTASEMARPYNNPNSFGQTYGEHREFLELSDKEHRELYDYAKQRNLDVIETICNPGALSLLNHFKPDRLKVASRDLTNLPLLEALAETNIPIILSTGMAGQVELDQALEIVTRQHNQITILHCLSQYPAAYKNVNLNAITRLIKQYPEYTIGYSDHSEGIMVPIAAIALGAQVIEKHVTLNRGMKGSDHAGSLAPDGLFRLMRDLRHLEESFGEETIAVHPAAEAAREKLERSIAAKRDLPAGHIVSEDDIHLLSPGTGVRWAEREQIVGQALAEAVKQDELILLEHVGQPVPAQ